jgi:hypothetical protein
MTVELLTQLSGTLCQLFTLDDSSDARGSQSTDFLPGMREKFDTLPELRFCDICNKKVSRLVRRGVINSWPAHRTSCEHVLDFL